MGIAISIGLADSLNPSTIGPALYLASGERARGRVAEFTAGVFLVYLLGGVAVALGPGELLRSALPLPHHHLRHIIELVVGATMVVAAGLLWWNRGRLTEREPLRFDPRGKSAWVLGATITAVELPTAFPYFAAIAAIVGSGVGPLREVGLLVLFNACFVLPLLGIVTTLTFAGQRAEPLLSTGRGFLHRHWPELLSGLALVAGVIVIGLGATGFSHHGHNHLGRLLRRILHP